VPSLLLVDVPAETVVSEPIVITLKGSDATVTEAGHLVLRFAGDGERHLEGVAALRSKIAGQTGTASN